MTSKIDIKSTAIDLELNLTKVKLEILDIKNEYYI